MTTPSRVLLTPGEPAGIGPDIAIQLAQKEWPSELVAVCDPELLLERAKILQLPLQIAELNTQSKPEPHRPRTLKIIPASLKTTVIPGQLNAKNAEYVLESLKTATHYCLQGIADALVTGPVHKGIMNEAGIPFTGHTEFLADYCRSPQVIMLFVVNQLKVALMTTHLPLAQVPAAITQDSITRIIHLLHQELKKYFGLSSPRILVCGLNPHAGENGHLGKEEINTITPALERLKAENINVIGPLPADTIFTEKYLKNADAIVAMYHDQALPVVKYLGFSHAVNVTLGLPIIRTSVDHGTALDMAGTHQADPGSLIAATQLAQNLIETIHK